MNLLLNLLRQESPVIQRLSCPQNTTDKLPQLDMTSRQLRLMPLNQCQVKSEDESCCTLPEFQYDSKYLEARQEAHHRGCGDFNDWVYEDEDEDDVDWEYWDEEGEARRPDFLKIDDGFEVINEADKILVFTTGDLAHVPHQVGIKKLAEVRYDIK